MKYSIAYINHYFLIPFFVWVAIGGGLLCAYTQERLFMAINGYHNAVLDSLMPYITLMGQAEVVIPLLLLLLIIPRLRGWRYFSIAAIANLIPFFTQQWLKRVFAKPRPIAYFHHAPWIHHLPAWHELLRDSFPSGHSQGSFSLFCFLSLLLPAKFRYFGIVFFFLALMVGYSRIYLAAHFFEDVYAGSIIGTITTTTLALLVQYLMLKQSKNT
ncbi:MAG: phosphatase PAP2 family protein [Chitinophagia bacterium]|nr:phosphatase PAP2 family protein [Chitinophagia bacterium]